MSASILVWQMERLNIPPDSHIQLLSTIQKTQQNAHNPAFKLKAIEMAEEIELLHINMASMNQQWDNEQNSGKNQVSAKWRQKSLVHIKTLKKMTLMALVDKRLMKIATNEFSDRLKYVLFSNQTCYCRVALMPYCRGRVWKKHILK